MVPMKKQHGETQWVGKVDDPIPQYEQGDILSIEDLNFPVLVVSKNFFHQSEQAIVCPIRSKAAPDPLHIKIIFGDLEGIVLCEQMKLLDLRYRGYKKIERIAYIDLMNISDAIQAIFEY